MNDSIYIARWPGLLGATTAEQGANRSPTTTAPIPRSQSKKLVALVAVTEDGTLEHYTDMQTAVEALMPAGANYESEKNKVYQALAGTIDTALKRSWRRDRGEGSDEWYDVPLHLIPENAMKRVGWQVTKSGRVRSPAGKEVGFATTDNYISIQV
jgi:hypothetical protein